MMRRALRTVAMIALPAMFTAGAVNGDDTDVNRRNADGSTPLQWAVYKGDAAEVRRCSNHSSGTMSPMLFSMFI